MAHCLRLCNQLELEFAITQSWSQHPLLLGKHLMLLGISGSKWTGLVLQASGLFEGFLSAWQHLAGIWLNCLIAKLLA